MIEIWKDPAVSEDVDKHGLMMRINAFYGKESDCLEAFVALWSGLVLVWISKVLLGYYMTHLDQYL